MNEVYLKLHVEALDEGGYVATSVDLPGLVAQGGTLFETIEIANDVERKLIESYEEPGDPLPPGIKKPGFEYARNAKGSHEIWWNPATRLRTTIPNNPGDIPEGTLVVFCT